MILTADEHCMLFDALDQGSTGTLDFIEFLHMVSHFKAERQYRSRSLRGQLKQKFEQRRNSRRIRKAHPGAPHLKGGVRFRRTSNMQRFMVRCTGKVRICWDVWMLLPLAYLVITVPLRLGFEIEDDDIWFFLERLVDAFFVLDVLVNLRTTFFNDDGVEIVGSVRCAMHYVTGWMFVDVVSSIPWDLIMGWCARMGAHICVRGHARMHICICLHMFEHVSVCAHLHSNGCAGLRGLVVLARQRRAANSSK